MINEDLLLGCGHEKLSGRQAGRSGRTFPIPCSLCRSYTHARTYTSVQCSYSKLVTFGWLLAWIGCTYGSIRKVPFRLDWHRTSPLSGGYFRSQWCRPKLSCRAHLLTCSDVLRCLLKPPFWKSRLQQRYEEDFFLARVPHLKINYGNNKQSWLF